MKLIKNIFSKTIKILGILTLFLILAVFLTTIGYKAVFQETKVAEIILEPKGNQQFKATIIWLTGKKSVYNINGDQLYIDAKILKWKGWASFIGLKTWYEFDRIGGRYVNILDEKNKQRSVFELSREKDFDLYNIRKKYPMLNFFVDSEYGSAAFFMADVAKTIELSVSSSGLFIRTQSGDTSPKINID